MQNLIVLNHAIILPNTSQEIQYLHKNCALFFEHAGRIVSPFFSFTNFTQVFTESERVSLHQGIKLKQIKISNDNELLISKYRVFLILSTANNKEIIFRLTLDR